LNILAEDPILSFLLFLLLFSAFILTNSGLGTSASAFWLRLQGAVLTALALFSALSLPFSYGWPYWACAILCFLICCWVLPALVRRGQQASHFIPSFPLTNKALEKPTSQIWSLFLGLGLVVLSLLLTQHLVSHMGHDAMTRIFLSPLRFFVAFSLLLLGIFMMLRPSSPALSSLTDSPRSLKNTEKLIGFLLCLHAPLLFGLSQATLPLRFESFLIFLGMGVFIANLMTRSDKKHFLPPARQDKTQTQSLNTKPEHDAWKDDAWKN